MKIPGNFLNNGKYIITVWSGIPMQKTIVFKESILGFTVEKTGGVGGDVEDGRLGVVKPRLFWQNEFSKKMKIAVNY